MLEERRNAQTVDLDPDDDEEIPVADLSKPRTRTWRASRSESSGF